MSRQNCRVGSAAPTSSEKRANTLLDTWNLATGQAGGEESPRINHKAARARSWLNELTFGTFNVCRAAINGVNGISHIDTC